MKMKIFISFLIAASVLAGLPFSGFKNANVSGAGLAEHEDHEIIVKFKTSEKPVKVFLAPDEDLENVISEYEKNPAVLYAEPNFKYRASIIPSDTYYGDQWYLKKIKAQEAWDLKRESPNVVIAIIDSGVQITHPDLRENIWINREEIPANGIDDDRDGYIDDVNGWDFVNSEADPSPKFKEGFTEGGINHGTVVAGIAAAGGNNASGISGVTWRAKIMPLKVLGDAGEGSTLNVVRAIDYAIKKGANILNFSFVGFGYSEALNEAIGRARAAGLIIVAAAGNESEDGQGNFLDETPMYPVCHDGPAGENWVIGVAAVDAIDQKSKFSSFGFKCVDISAPGESVFSSVVYAPEKSIGEKSFNKYYDGYWSGTSVAAPQVSGALSLLLEADYGLGRDEIIALLFNNTDNISRVNPAFLGQLGRGRLNVFNSLQMALSGVSPFKGGIVSVPFSGAEANIKIADKDGKIEAEFSAFDLLFRGGASVVGGDVDADGTDEIIAGAGAGGGPHVRIFSADGKIKNQFFAYDSRFRGGVNVAAGDVDGDGK
ncbi:MAG: S8 family peptidase, partial [Patescibacteria group bacterium]